MNEAQIKDYYDACQKDYKRVWHLDRCMAMHMGFWDQTTRCLKDALIRENELLAEMANIQSSDKVLDAGCGVGGSAIYLAKNIGCHATGITITPSQIAYAKQYAKQHNVSDKTTFEIADYTQTHFPDESFDVVWAIESTCYIGNNPAFQKEAFRLLKRGGRLMVADGFQSKFTLNKKEEKLLGDFTRGWGIESLASEHIFRDNIEIAGFQNIIEENVTSMIIKSSRRLYWLSFPAFLVDLVERAMGKRGSTEYQNVLAAYNQYRSLMRNLWVYKVFVATKY